jgi:hypothetical protein
MAARRALLAAAALAVACHAASPTLELVRMNATLLGYAKSRVAAGDAELRPAYDALIAQADAALTAGALRVAAVVCRA